MTPASPPRSGQAPRPWWRFGYLWLIIGIFAVAIAGGGVVTVYLAAQVPEATRGAAAQAQESPADGALEPAMQARNRASSRNARALGRDGEK